MKLRYVLFPVVIALTGCGGSNSSNLNPNAPQSLVGLNENGERATFAGTVVTRINGNIVQTDSFTRVVQIEPYTFEGRNVQAFRIETRTNGGAPVVVYDVFEQDPTTRVVTSLAIVNDKGTQKLQNQHIPGRWVVGTTWTTDSGLFDIDGLTRYRVIGTSRAYTEAGEFNTWVVRTSEDEPAFVAEGTFDFDPVSGWYVESRGRYEADAEAGLLEIDSYGEMTSYTPAG